MSARMTSEEHADALAANFPIGRVWHAKNRSGSNLRGLIKGMAPTFRLMDNFLEHFVDQSIPTTTEDYLAEWEEALGIPDDCFDLGSTVAERQFAIKVKLVVLAGISTEQDFVDLAALFGLTISAKSGIDHVSVAEGGYETASPTIALASFTGGTIAAARMTLVIGESYPPAVGFSPPGWEFTPPGLQFETAGQNSLRCLIQKLAPANVEVMFAEV